jgi:hypothetical protein
MGNLTPGAITRYRWISTTATKAAHGRMLAGLVGLVVVVDEGDFLYL